MKKLNKSQRKCPTCRKEREVSYQEEMTFYTCCSETCELISVMYCQTCKVYSLRND